MTGRLYLLAHTDPHAKQRLDEIMAVCCDLCTIVDIRADTRAQRYSGWSQARLADFWAFKYIYKGHSLSERELSVLGGPAEGVPWLISYLQRPRHIVLLTKDASETNAQLATILRMVKEALPDVEVIGE